MENLSKKEVLHVANLARLNIEENEIARYQSQLSSIMSEIDKITEVELENEEVMVSPIFHENRFKEDTPGAMLTKEEVFKNVKNVKEEYVVVPKVLND